MLELGSDLSGSEDADEDTIEGGARPGGAPEATGGEETEEEGGFGADEYTLLESMCQEFAQLWSKAGRARLAVIAGLLSGVPEDLDEAAKELVGWRDGQVRGGGREAWLALGGMFLERHRALFPDEPPEPTKAGARPHPGT